MLLNCGIWKTLESPMDCKEIQPVHPKGDQSWVFFGRTDVEAETLVVWPPVVKSWLIWKDPDAGKDWGQEKGTTEDERVGWHHWLYGHEFGHALGVGDGQGGLACCDSWGFKELDVTERLNWTEPSNMGEGNGNPLQCSCLENPRDSRAWWAAVYGVTQSWTRLKWLSSSSSNSSSSTLKYRDMVNR